jgi:hypothetical protein
MFDKLNLTFPTKDYSGGDLVISFGKNPKLSYYSIPNSEIDLSCFKYRPTIRYCEIVGGGFLRPHIDHAISCCVNFYIQSNSCTTHFYEAHAGATRERYNGKTSSNLYDVNDLTEVSSFLAGDGDCYLLDVSKIHSVSIPKVGIRKFLSFNWFDDHSYEEIKESLTCN